MSADRTQGDDGLRQRLADEYLEGHARAASGGMYDDVTAPWPHYDANYAAIVDALPRSARILEIGPGHGGLIAWLRARGFSAVEGVDTSRDDVDFANEHLGAGTVAFADARTFTSERPERYDAVILKAVLEHVPRGDVLPLLEAIASSLRPGALVVVEVPNMDWLLSAHERYMDLTHETGYTRESLHALLRLVFADVEVRGSALARPTRSQRLLRRPLLAVLRRLLYVVGEGANDLLFEHRSIVATARRR